MKLKSIKDITDESIKEIAASQVRDFIEEQLSLKSQEWDAEKKEKEEKLVKATADLTALSEEVKTAKEQLDQTKADLEKIQAAQAARDADEKFQSRMNGLSAEYKLSDEESQIVAEEVKACDTDESFDKLTSRYAVLFKSKKVEEVKASTETVVASTEVEKVAAVTAAVETAVVETVAITNATTTAEPTLAERMKNAFADDNLILKK